MAWARACAARCRRRPRQDGLSLQPSGSRGRPFSRFPGHAAGLRSSVPSGRSTGSRPADRGARRARRRAERLAATASTLVSLRSSPSTWAGYRTAGSPPGSRHPDVVGRRRSDRVHRDVQAVVVLSPACRPMGGPAGFPSLLQERPRSGLRMPDGPPHVANPHIGRSGGHDVGLWKGSPARRNWPARRLSCAGGRVGFRYWSRQMRVAGGETLLS